MRRFEVNAKVRAASQFSSARGLACWRPLRYGNCVKRVVVILTLLSLCGNAQARFAHACLDAQSDPASAMSASFPDDTVDDVDSDHHESSGGAGHHCDFCGHTSSVPAAHAFAFVGTWPLHLPEPVLLPGSVIGDPVPDRLYKPPR